MIPNQSQMTFQVIAAMLFVIGYSRQKVTSSGRKIKARFFYVANMTNSHVPKVPRVIWNRFLKPRVLTRERRSIMKKTNRKEIERLNSKVRIALLQMRAYKGMDSTVYFNFITPTLRKAFELFELGWGPSSTTSRT